MGDSVVKDDLWLVQKSVNLKLNNEPD